VHIFFYFIEGIFTVLYYFWYNTSIYYSWVNLIYFESSVSDHSIKESKKCCKKYFNTYTIYFCCKIQLHNKSQDSTDKISNSKVLLITEITNYVGCLNNNSSYLILNSEIAPIVVLKWCVCFLVFFNVCIFYMSIRRDNALFFNFQGDF